MSERADMTIYAFKRVHEPHPDDESRPWCKEDLGMTGEPPWVVVPRYDLDPGADFDLLCDELFEERCALRSLRGSGRVTELSDREREVVALVAAGESYKAVAERLGITVDAVGAYCSRAYDKLGAQNARQAAINIALTEQTGGRQDGTEDGEAA